MHRCGLLQYRSFGQQATRAVHCHQYPGRYFSMGLIPKSIGPISRSSSFGQGVRRAITACEARADPQLPIARAAIAPRHGKLDAHRASTFPFPAFRSSPAIVGRTVIPSPQRYPASGHRCGNPVRSLPREAKVGFVPTMGAFHEGHLDLFRRARSDCEIVVGSVFVNPLQFGPQEDFGRYPRKLESDVGKLAAKGLADLVFAPSLDAMYLPSHRLYVDPVGFDDLSEGLARPGFFRGVATVVIKLFNVVQPDYAYFGQKDALQCVLVRRLVEDLNVPVQLVVCDTKREPDGLAMSSRNAYMSPAERSAAPVVFRALRAAAEARQRAVAAARCATREELINEAEAVLSSEPLVTSIEYLSVGSLSTMEEIEKVGNAGAIVSVALRLGSVRLIDNIMLPPL